MKQKFFTPQQANKRLPLIKKIVEDILSRGKKLKALAILEQTSSVEEQANALTIEVEQLMDELEVLGCHFKDWNFEIGLVDFPSEINGQKVLLCWRSDEPHLRWYHGFSEGYAGRKLIPENLLPSN